MMAFLFIAVVLVAVASGAGAMYLHRSPATMQAQARASVDLHRTRNDIEGAIFKQAVKSDGRRLRRELRHELDALEREQ
jgi:hypothetical protein